MNRVVRSAVVLACIATVAGTGCAKRSHGLIVAGVGLAATVATVLAINNCKEDGCGTGVILLLLPSGGVFVGGVVGAATARSAGSRVAPQTIIPPGEEADPELDTAIGLTARARFAAESGDCDSVGRFAERVQKADPAYYQSDFLTDPGIARCMAAVTPDAGSSPPQPPMDAAPAPTPMPVAPDAGPPR